jgi:hypothetical protein
VWPGDDTLIAKHVAIDVKEPVCYAHITNNNIALKTQPECYDTNLILRFSILIFELLVV